MQNLNPGSNDSVTTSEAQEILAAWSNRMTAQGVDPHVGSVQALASSLGVSEDHVRQMLEDIRVQKRSQAIAAGIIDEQQKHRKRSDINAAIVAAIAIVLVAIVVGGFIFFSARADRGVIAVVPDEPPTFIEPPIPPGTPTFAHFEDGAVSITDQDGSITIDRTGYHKAGSDGTVISLRGTQALDAIREDIKEVAQQMAELKAKKEPLSESDRALSGRLKTRQDALKQGLKIVVTDIPTPAPTADR